MEEIKAWLAAEDKSYWRGLELLEKHSSLLALCNQLRRNQTKANLDRLNYELSKLAGVDYVPLAGTVVNEPAVHTVDDSPAGDLLRELIAKRGELYALRALESDKLADLEGEALKEATLKVTQLDDQTIALTSQIAYVEKHGHLPEPTGQLAEDVEALKARKKTLGEKASRLRGALKRNAGNLNKQAELQQTEAEIETINAELRRFNQS